MTYLKPYWTLWLNSVILSTEQYDVLVKFKLIKKEQRTIHINLLARWYKLGYLPYVTTRQVKRITELFESIGYRFNDWIVRRTQVGNSLIFDHNK